MEVAFKTELDGDKWSVDYAALGMTKTNVKRSQTTTDVLCCVVFTC